MSLRFRHVFAPLVLACFILVSEAAQIGPETLWLKTFDTGGRDLPGGMAVDPNGNVIMTAILSTNLAVAFYKVDPEGTLIWARTLPVSVDQIPSPPDIDSSTSVLTDSQGNIYALAFSPRAGPNQLSRRSLMKFSPQGVLLWTLHLGTENFWYARESMRWEQNRYKMAVDSSDHLYLATQISASTSPDTETVVYIAKITPDGTILWKGGSGNRNYLSQHRGVSAALDQDGFVYFTGIAENLDGQTVPRGTREHYIFVSKYSSTGSMIWLTPAGGRDLAVAGDRILALSYYDITLLDQRGEIVTNWVAGSSVYPSVAAATPDNAFLIASFVSDGRGYSVDGALQRVLLEKRSRTGAFLWQKAFSAMPLTWVRHIAYSPTGECYVFGGFGGLAAFDGKVVQGVGDYGVYLAKIAAETIPTPPRIVEQPASREAVVGSSVTFSITAESLEPAAYQWYFNSSVLPGATNRELVIRVVTPANAGNYRVEVTNSAGTARSETAELKVVGQIEVMVSTLAGTNQAGYFDSAQPSQVRFHRPNGLAHFASGLIAIADGHNHVIRLLDLAGNVGTYAGLPQPGLVNGPATSARFNYPLGLTVAPNLDLLIADSENNVIRAIDSFGLRSVRTVAGSGQRGYLDGAASSSRFSFPNDLVTDAQGNIFVTEFLNHTVRMINLQGEVRTVAGTGSPGYRDGAAAQALFNAPAGLAIDSQNNIFVTEWENHRLRKISSSGQVTTLAGGGAPGFRDGFGTNALFNRPDGIALDNSGNLYVVENGNHAVRKIDPLGNVTTVAGLGAPGLQDGDASVALFNAPGAIAFHPNGSLIVADTENHAIRRVSFMVVTNSGAANLALHLYPGLTIYGILGRTYRIEAAEEVSSNSWSLLDTVTLTNEAQQWFDPQPANRKQRLYRAVRTP